MNSALFKFEDNHQTVIIDLSSVVSITQYSQPYVHIAVQLVHRDVTVPAAEGERLIKAWSDYKDHQDEVNQPMMLAMAPEQNGGLLDVFGGGLR